VVSALDVRQKDVLLRFVEVMDLVDEQDRFAAGGAKTVLGRGDDFAHLGDVAFDAAEALELRVGHVGDDVSQCRFASSGWAGEDEGGKAIGFNGAAQKFSRRKDVFLADELIEGSWAHAGGEGSRSADGFFVRLVGGLKQVLHE
jgi:hypothetical protein